MTYTSNWAFDKKPEPTREEKNAQWHAFRQKTTSRWAFNIFWEATPVRARLDALLHRVERMEEHERNQEGLARMEGADPEFAKAITKRLVPDSEPVPPEVIHRRVSGRVVVQRRGGR